jgi:plastocyanin
MTLPAARTAAIVALCCFSPWPAGAGPVSGVVRTVAEKSSPAATPVVYAEPLDQSAPRQPQKVVLGQKNKTFQPRGVAVPVGSTVEFPNNDQIFHNVFSLSLPQPFDLGLYRAGESRTRTFTQPGVYRVFCNIHPQMSAIVVVAPSPYVAVVPSDGRFSLELPVGRYRLTALSERAAPVSADVASVQGLATAPELQLDESAWKFTQHKNKFGQEYPAAAYNR